MLCQYDKVLFRANGTAQWFFPLEVLGNVGVIGWPALLDGSYMHDGTELLLFRPAAGQAQWFFICNENEWEAMQFEWWSPMHQMMVAEKCEALRDVADEQAVRAVCI